MLTTELNPAALKAAVECCPLPTNPGAREARTRFLDKAISVYLKVEQEVLGEPFPVREPHAHERARGIPHRPPQEA